jgi:hypothetical protein
LFHYETCSWFLHQWWALPPWTSGLLSR